MKRDIIVATQNVLRAGAAVDRVFSRRDFGSLVLLTGPAGTGKTMSGKAIARKFGGAFVRARQVWTVRSMLSDILSQIGGCHLDFLHQPATKLYERLREELSQRELPLLIVDESDYLCRRFARIDLLNVLRDLADEAAVVVVFISVNELAQHLTTPGRFLQTVSSRIGARVEFERPSIADAVNLARELVEGVIFERDLVSYCLRASAGSIRPLLGLYAEIERGAKRTGAKSLNLAECVTLGLGAVAPSGAKADEKSPLMNMAPAKVRAA